MTEVAQKYHHGYGSYYDWLFAVCDLFPQKEEFTLAESIYSFHAAYKDGLTPQQAYDDFDAWTQE